MYALLPNTWVTPADATYIETLFGRISNVLSVEEEQFEAGGDLMSCAPALMAVMVEEFACAGIRHRTLSREQAYAMAFSTLYGTALLINQGMTAEEIKKTCGNARWDYRRRRETTARQAPPIFDHLFYFTLTKHAFVRECIHQIQKDLSA